MAAAGPETEATAGLTDIEEIEANIAVLLETTANMAGALSSIDSSTAKKARKHSVAAIETIEFVRSRLHELIEGDRQARQ